MADTYTTNLNLTKPEPGAAEDTWGISLNADLDSLDAIFSSSGTQINLNPNQINFADGKKAIFGTGSDLSIYHSGTNSHIADTGEGNLYLDATNLIVRNGTGTETYMTAANNGGVVLYHDNTSRVSTTSTGIDVTGTVKASTSLMVGSTDAPARDFEIKTTNPHIRLTDTDASGGYTEIFGGSGITTINADKGQAVAGSALKLSVDATDGLTIDSNHNVDIPNGNLDVTGTVTSDGLTVEAASNGTTVTTSSFKNNGIGANTKARLDFFAASTRYAGISGGYGASAPELSFDISGTDVLDITSTGIDVTGTVTTNGLTVDANSVGLLATFIGSNNARPLTIDNYDADFSGSGYIFNAESAGGEIALQTASKDRIKVGSGGDISFYDDTGSTQGFFWDASAERLGIGNTSPKSLLNVTGTGADGGILTLENDSSSLITDRKVGQIHFYSNDGSANGTGVKADIKAIAENSIGSEIGLAFGTSGTGSATAVEAMRISADGSVGIGTASPDAALEVNSGGGIHLTDNAVGRTLIIKPSLTGSVHEFTSDNTAAGYSFSNSSSELMRVNSTGLGIGTTSPTAKLESLSTSAGSDSAALHLRNASNTADTEVRAYFTPNTSTALDRSAYIGAKSETVGNDSELVFGTNASGASASERMRISAAGNVGIGTDSPQGNLHVEGAAGVSGGGIIYVTDADNGSTASDALQISKSGDTAFIYNRETSGNLQIGAGGNANHMIVRTDGKVGIGTTSPAVALDIAGSSTTQMRVQMSGQADTRVLSDTGTGIVGTYSNHPLNIKTNGSTVATIDTSGNVGIGAAPSTHTLEVWRSGGDHLLLGRAGVGTYELGVSTDNALTFEDGGSERMRIDSSGNVGIGTSTPQSKLDVNLGNNETASIGGTISNGTYAGLRFGYSEAGNTNYRHSAIVFERDDASFGDARGNIHILNSPSGSTSADLGDARLTILPSGNVGIGTTSPACHLEVSGSGNGSVSDHLRITSTDTQAKLAFVTTTGNGAIYQNGYDLVFATNTANTERMRIDSSGNVGIGTASPSKKLHVQNGSSGFTGSYNSRTAAIIEGSASNGTALSIMSPSTGVSVIYFGDESQEYSGQVSYDHSVNSMRFVVSGSEKARFDYLGNFGIGTDSPSALIHGSGSNAELRLQHAGNSYYQRIFTDSSNNLKFGTGANGTERMRLDASGNLLVGKTANSIDTVGGLIRANGQIGGCVDGDYAGVFNRKTSDGNIVLFRKDTSTVGTIGTQEPQDNAPELYIANGTGTNSTGLAFWDYIYPTRRISPCNGAGTYVDNAIDLGYSGARFKDLYLSGGVQLGGTGAANKLDDYEEGTWTPTLYAATTGTNRVTSIISATYTKIGRLVRCKAYLAVVDGTALNGDSGAIQLGGLPFTAFAYGHLRTLYSNLSSSSITGIVTGTVVGLRVDDSQVALQPSNINTGSNNIMIDVTFEA